MRPTTSHISRHLFFLTFALCGLAMQAQVAGLTTLSVLDMPTSTHAAALGMDFVALPAASIDVALDNPSQITPHLSGQMELGYIGMSRGLNFGTLAYSHSFNNIGSFVFGLRFCSYGSFEGYSEEEVNTGSFSASDYVFSIGWGRAIDSNFFFGATAKPIYSHYEQYSAFAIAFDVAARFVSDNRLFAASVAARNIGAQIATFDNTVERIPSELAIGLSYKLKNAPFRFYFNITELQKWNLRYEDGLNPTTDIDPFTGEVKKESWTASFFDNLGRHLQVGVELNIKRTFFARIGYNYRQSAEMKGADAFNTSGLSFGLAFVYKGFEFGYSHNNYHFWQAPNYISITTDIDRFFR